MAMWCKNCWPELGSNTGLLALAKASWNTAVEIRELRQEMKFMPQLTVEGVGTFEVPAGKRLVLALEQDAGIDQLHACGGNARCTTCRVEFVVGEPDRMTVA